MTVAPVVGEVGRYHVDSAGGSGLVYLVDLDAEEIACGHWCSCPHFEFKVASQLLPDADCKHIRAVREYVEVAQ